MTRSVFRLAIVVALWAPAKALAVHSDWSIADEAQMRLLIAGPGDGEAAGTIAGGVEVVLEPEWYTYWRNPGEAGVPPVFDFAASENVASVEVLYPAPQRYDDGLSVSLVYHDEVVFPLLIEPVDATQPVTLRLDMAFGVCSDVCIPTQASAAATLPPGAPHDPLAEARLARFVPMVPVAAEPGRFEITSVTVGGDALTIAARMPESGYLDLFADPPAGWFIGQPAFVSRADGISRYRLSLAGKPKDAQIEGQTFRFVAVSSGEAIEQAIEIH